MALDEAGLEDSAILLMSLGEEEAAAVFKHLSPKEVQKVGEAMSKLRTVDTQAVDTVLERFGAEASQMTSLVPDADAYIKNVLKRALGEFVVDGIETTIPLFTALIAEPEIVDGNYDIHWLEKHLANP